MDPQVMREKVCSLLKEKLACEDDTTAKRAEVSIYNWAISYSKKHGINRNWTNPHFKSCYMNKAMTITNNLSDAKNPYLREKLADGSITVEQLPDMSPQQLFPDIWKPHIQALKLKEEKSLNQKVLPMSNRFTCPKCKHKECVYHQLQIRSGDEASTLFLRCLKCNNNWRING